MKKPLRFSQQKDVLGSFSSRQGLSQALSSQSKQAVKETVKMKLNYCHSTKSDFSFFLLQQFIVTR